MAGIKRLQVRVNGIVQGVGFRPYVYRLACAMGLAGWVINEPEGVLIEIEGLSECLDAFLNELIIQSPPLAVIEKLSTIEKDPRGDSAFFIGETKSHSPRRTLISPDVAVCDECLAEMFNPADRRYLYPFINCTNCGPRFTIINDLPYDRAKTTMAGFTMCEDCLREYKDPSSRRFHAEPNACPRCGPQALLVDKGGNSLPGSPIMQAAAMLQRGAVVAVKGLGGFHLACDAANEKSVGRLREGKDRERKPFAIMSRDLVEIEKFCFLTSDEMNLLKDSRRPIVLLRKKPDAPIAGSVAPGTGYYGVMLPYTPLHHLILENVPLGLVMTSGNRSSEPIIFRHQEALNKLGDVADYFLVYDRDIYQRCDDSVVTSFAGREMVLRRARGYAPSPVKLPFEGAEILACGAELKNTFCLTKGNYAFISQHIGDLTNPDALSSFEEGIEHFKKVFDVNPAIIAHDLHPDYLSTRYGLEQPGVVRYGVQHHHAHCAACMAENGVTGNVIGVIFDGSGLGPDGTLWGGEFLVCNYAGFTRAGHIRPGPLVSGAQAVREPWRLAAVYMKLVFGDDFLDIPIPFTATIERSVWRLLNQSMDRNINAPLSSGMGRLFDAVSALLGICGRINYEGQAAVELEHAADHDATGVYNYGLVRSGDVFTVDTLPMIKDIVGELRRGEDRSLIAGRFHNTVADFSLRMCSLLRENFGLNEVALSGGVFQNRLLLEKMTCRLAHDGFKAYTHSRIPPNDGGISLGQAVIAAERSKRKCV